MGLLWTVWWRAMGAPITAPVSHGDARRRPHRCGGVADPRHGVARSHRPASRLREVAPFAEKMKVSAMSILTRRQAIEFAGIGVGASIASGMRPRSLLARTRAQ